MAQQLSTNNFGPAKWIVNATAYLGTHTTISTALTSASSGDTIFIMPGTYTENLTLKAGVNLAAYDCDALNGNVTISGTCTFTAAGTVDISGIRLQTNSAALLAVTGSAASIVNLKNCYLNCTNNNGITFSSSSASAVINFYNCIGDLGTTGINLFAHSSAGTMNGFSSNFTNTGASTTASTVSAGNLNLNNVNLQNPITSSSTSTFFIIYSNLDCSAINATSLTCGGSAGNVVISRINSGTASAVSTSITMSLYQCNIGSSNTNAITGAGTIVYGGLTFGGTSSKINTTTQVGGLLQGGLTQAPSAGWIGERISSTVASGSAINLSNGVAANITSLSLTAGVWELNAFAEFTSAGSTVVTNQVLSISTTTNTLSGAFGDTQAIWQYPSGIGGVNLTLVVPSVRIVITATTTYYMVASAGFTVSTMVAYGRFSATRVG